LFLAAIFLRFYNFYQAVTFLGDQGRDTIIVKRIVTLEHFPAIGAPSSIGGIFLGPFYYYLVAPFLFLARFNPIGPALGVAFISLIGLIVFYFILKNKFSQKVALYATAFLVFSNVQISFARFSWNPNLLPLFAFLTLYFFTSMLEKPKLTTSFLFGSFLSFSLQLHYLAAFLILPIAVVYLSYFIKHKQKQTALITLFQAVIGFAVFFSPLVLFDLKHQFINSHSFIQLFSSNSFVNHSSYWERLNTTIVNLWQHIFNFSFPSWFSLIIFSIFIIYYLMNFRQIKKNYLLNVVYLNFIFYPLFFAFLNSPRYPHYYGTIYYSSFIVISYLFLNNKKSKLFPTVGAFFLIVFFIFFNSQKYIFLKEGNNQIERAKNIANSIIKHQPQLPYQIVAIPSTETDGHIRYFLEINGYRPMPEDTNEYVKELFVLCREEKCSPDNSPQWQIAAFKNAKIKEKWFAEDFYIYKIIHGN
jgi:hypothetical protein